MEKRYQVFVSSTYDDLKEERQEVMHALLELDCIPSGMELFPAASEDLWSLIKRVIEDCDYYVLILAGRYGSCAPDGLSYTEKEYRYAVDCGKPVLAFLHSDPGKIPSAECESAPEGKGKLEGFRELVKQKPCKNWSTPSDLGGVVSRSLLQQIRRTPAIGWVRADEVLGPEAIRELMDLRQKVRHLEDELAKARHAPPQGTDQLAQGEDPHSIRYTCVIRTRHDDLVTESNTFQTTWNAIFAALSPQVMGGLTDFGLQEAIERFIADHQVDYLKSRYAGSKVGDFRVHEQDFLTIWVQLRTLGLISSIVKDDHVYWTLTGHGQDIMTSLRAIRKTAAIDGSLPLDPTSAMASS